MNDPFKCGCPLHMFIPDIIEIRLLMFSHNTLNTESLSCKESSVYCAVISVLFFLCDVIFVNRRNNLKLGADIYDSGH